MASAEHYIFVTGRLAERSLTRLLNDLTPRTFSFEVRVLGVSVAALLTCDMIGRRLDNIRGATKVIVPGRARGLLDPLTQQFGVTFERGPEELKDLPGFLGGTARARDLTQHDCLVFAEIVEAPTLSVDDCVARAVRYRDDGADVIDVGCLPDTSFPHLADCVRALKAAGFAVSVDSLNTADLVTGAAAGADYLFSLHEETLWIAERYPVTPILIGREPGDLASCIRTIEAFLPTGKPFFADPILDPIHSGFTSSLLRFHVLRERYPHIGIMCGIGNLSELTHADSLGLNTLLMGVVSELRINAVLTTEVSAHCRSAVREIAHARRIMYAAREENLPPRHIDEGLLALHERKPFPYSSQEIGEFAAEVKDTNYRIQVAADGIHIYNRDSHQVISDPYDAFAALGVHEDGAHAFYLGLELARAQVAFQLGKRYAQDEELAWGCVRPKVTEDKAHFNAERSTLQARKARRVHKHDK